MSAGEAAFVLDSVSFAALALVPALLGLWVGWLGGIAEGRDRERARPKPAEPETWPIAKLTVHEDSEQVSVMLYAPGLPVGEFDVWLGPQQGESNA